MLARPPALQRIAIRDDLMRLMTQRLQIGRIKIGGPEAVIHERAPLLGIGTAREIPVPGIHGAQEAGVIRIDDQKFHRRFLIAGMAARPPPVPELAACRYAPGASAPARRGRWLAAR